MSRRRRTLNLGEPVVLLDCDEVRNQGDQHVGMAGTITGLDSVHLLYTVSLTESDTPVHLTLSPASFLASTTRANVDLRASPEHRLVHEVDVGDAPSKRPKVTKAKIEKRAHAPPPKREAQPKPSATPYTQKSSISEIPVLTLPHLSCSMMRANYRTANAFKLGITRLRSGPNPEVCGACENSVDADGLECDDCGHIVHGTCMQGYSCTLCVRAEFHLKMLTVMAILEKKDRPQFFWFPVSKAVAPDYFSIVKEPMDFERIHKVIDRLGYEDFAGFVVDVNTVWTNALLYNKKGTDIHNAALSMKGLFKRLVNKMLGTGDSNSDSSILSDSDIEIDTLTSWIPHKVVFMESGLESLDLCLACGTGGPSLDMLRCVDCAQSLHYFCSGILDEDSTAHSVLIEDFGAFVSNPDETKPIHRLRQLVNWRCANCVLCEHCGRADGDTSELLQCDSCDNGVHLQCHSPPLMEVPDDGYRCDRCEDAIGHCHGCRNTTSRVGGGRNWTYFSHDDDVFGACSKCVVHYSKKEFCPRCLSVWSNDRDMVCCDKCDFWIHIDCEGVSQKQFLAMNADSSNPFVCGECDLNHAPVGSLSSATRELVPLNPVMAAHALGSINQYVFRIQEKRRRSRRRILLNISRTSDPAPEHSLMALQNAGMFPIPIKMPSLGKEPHIQYLTETNGAAFSSRMCSLCASGTDSDITGRLVPVSPRVWIHTMCAMWSSEVSELGLYGDLQNVPQAIQRGVSTTCPACRHPGATVTCCDTTCNITMHFLCAVQSEFAFLENCTSFCKVHRKHIPSSRFSSGLKAARTLRKIHVGSSSSPLSLNVDTVLRIGSLTVLCTGKREETGSTPVGYVSYRQFWSCSTPHKVTVYRCDIVSDTVFTITLVDPFVEEPVVFTGTSPQSKCTHA